MNLRLYRRLSRYIPYRQEAYWKARGKNYCEDFQHTLPFQRQEEELVQVLDTLQFRTVLEVGCGFGRMTKIVSEKYSPTEYKAFDISKDQILKAMALCTRRIDFAVSSISDFKSEKKFDLVLASEVLLHIKPNDIEKVINKLWSFTGKYLVTIDPYEMPKVHGGHAFIHPYARMFQKLSNDIVNHPIEASKQSIYVVKKMDPRTG